MFMTEVFAAQIMTIVEEQMNFDKMCEALPPDEIDRLRGLRTKERAEIDAHQRNLEVARAGRSLNFWGNR